MFISDRTSFQKFMGTVRQLVLSHWAFAATPIFNQFALVNIEPLKVK